MSTRLDLSVTVYGIESPAPVVNIAVEGGGRAVSAVPIAAAGAVLAAVLAELRSESRWP